MSKPPKMMSYFLFMQEQRKLVPGWSNKSNNELQALCDPLWRGLDRGEKVKYKKLKKVYKEKERLEADQRYAAAMQTEIRTKVVVGQVDKPDIVWVTKVKEMEDVQKQLYKAVMVSLPMEEVKVGTVAACNYSGDGEVYRCQVVAMQETDLVLVRYMDFGNMEKVKKTELCHLTYSLGKMGPIALRVRVGGMEGVKDNEKNRAKVEKKLGVEELEVSLNREGFATFYDNGKLLNFKNSKSKEDSVKLSESVLVEQSLVDENVTTFVKEESLKQTFVSEVVRGCLEVASLDELGHVEKENTLDPEMVPFEKTEASGEGGTDVKDGLDKKDKMSNDEDDSRLIAGVNPQAMEVFEECTSNTIKKIAAEISTSEGALCDCDNISGPEVLSFAVDNASLDDIDKTCNDKSSSGYSVSADVAADCEDIRNNKGRKSDDALSESSSGIGTFVALEDGDNDDKEDNNDLEDETLAAVESVAVSNKVNSGTDGDNASDAVTASKAEADGKTILDRELASSSSNRVSVLRPPAVRKKKTFSKSRKSWSGWKVGDAVVAQWVEDGVWRNGIVHEIVGDLAYVVCKEELVRSARVKVDQLRHSTMPVEVLNMLEKELVRGDEEASSLVDSSTDSSSSPGQEEFEQEEHFSQELVNLLDLLPGVDIAMLTSPSCSDLVTSLVMMIPSLPLSQLDRLVEGMIRQDLLVSAALHPAAYFLASQLVKHVMLVNSVMKGPVMNCLARQADELLMNICGREVLKTLHGYI